jgi:hypothetical protein
MSDKKGGIDINILKAENFDLSEGDINRITDGRANIMAYEDLERYDNINDILGQYGAVVILYETKKGFGHWVCLFKTGETHLEFFDPYGLNVDEELKIAPEFNLREHNGVLNPHLSVLIAKSNYKVSYNKTKLQKVLEHTNTCGRHVGMRIRFRDVSLPEYIKLITHNKCFDADFWVSALTLLI